MILYLEDPKNSTRKLKELINEFRKVAGLTHINQLHSYTSVMNQLKEKLGKLSHLQ